jgi:AAA15 family ATPase/GTPase
MLIYFKVGNFKSIKDPVVIDFAASSISEHRDTNVTAAKRHHLLRSVLLYGHNASGKTNMLDALVRMRWIIVNSAAGMQAGDTVPAEPFLLDTATTAQPSLFEVSFCLDDQIYRYGFEADNTHIHQEWLFETRSSDDIPLFLRMGDQVQVEDPRRLENSTGLEKRMRNNALFLSVASQWNVQKAEKILNWFRSIIPVNGLDDEAYKRTTLELMKDEKIAAEIKEFLRRADVGINGIGLGPAKRKNRRIPEDSQPDELGDLTPDELPTVFAYHQRFDAKGNPAGYVPFMMERQESKGTSKFFNLVGVFIRAIKENRLVIVDEFDARFHSLLTKAIIRLFNSDASGCTAQLLAATHDTALLDRDLLRRDQIGFVEKDKFGASHLTSLAEYKIRKEAPYDKNYLEGRFGAIPYIEDFESILKNG